MAEFIITEKSNLVDIADAIRNKTETTDTLSLEEMPQMIAGISTGAELNFTVVGGTIEPVNPTENMIWVNTDTEITSWAFAAEAPVSPVEGEVWFTTGAISTSAFNALKEYNITVCPSACKQYINGAFVDKIAKTYQASNWVDWVMWLFYNGNQYTELTGGWSKGLSVGTGGSVAVGGETISISLNQGDSEYGSNMSASHATAIDLTNFSTLTATVKKKSGPTIKGKLAISTSKSKLTNTAETSETTLSTSIKTLSLDISGLTGTFFVHAWAGTASGLSAGSVEFNEIKLS